MIEFKTFKTQQKSLKSNQNEKNLKYILISSKFGQDPTPRISKCKKKNRYGLCNLIKKGKSYTFENPKTAFIKILKKYVSSLHHQMNKL